MVLLARLDGLHELPEIAAGLGIETCRRLIQKQYRGVVHQGDREQQSLLLAAGELAVVAIRQFLERAQAYDFLDVEAARRTGRGTA